MRFLRPLREKPSDAALNYRHYIKQAVNFYLNNIFLTSVKLLKQAAGHNCATIF
jgi:hypothetical protein